MNKILKNFISFIVTLLVYIKGNNRKFLKSENIKLKKIYKEIKESL